MTNPWDPGYRGEWPSDHVALSPRSEDEDAIYDAFCDRHDPFVTWTGTRAEVIAEAQNHWDCVPLTTTDIE